MTRKIMAILVALLMGVVALTGGTAVADTAPKQITITGTLTYSTELESPHYLLQGYVVLNTNMSELQALTNQEVTVIGTELLPTIYMTKVVQVSKITPKRGTPPVGGIPLPGSGDTIVTIPEMPPMRGDGGGTVTIPAFPALVQVHTDLADRINTGIGAIYVAPKGEISIRLRGRFVQTNQAPIIGNGRALVGLRAIAEAMGAQVAWNPETRTATVTLDDRQVSVTIGSDQASMQRTGQTATAIQADVAPVIVNGRTMVPARLLSESLGLKVSWDEPTRTIDLQ
jgi:hypothetical protein